jgi:hypothetical protein
MSATLGEASNAGAAGAAVLASADARGAAGTRLAATTPSGSEPAAAIRAKAVDLFIRILLSSVTSSTAF